MLEEEPEMVLLEVADTGCGISQEMSHRLFERLYQVTDQIRSSRKGLGLGLYICKELISRLGGRISVKSKPGEGSTFSIAIPVFSMERLVAPLIRDGQWPAASAALLTVRIACRGAVGLNRGDFAKSQEAQSFIQRCLLPDLDLLLPTRHSSLQGHCFFVVVFADEAGRSAQSRRILAQFKRSRTLNNSGRTISLSYRCLPPFIRETSLPAASAAASMAALLEDAIQSQTLSEGLKHEPQDETSARRH